MRGGGQRKRDPDVGAPRSPDPGRTTPVSVQPRTRDRGCAARRGRGSLTIRGSWRRRRPARSLPVGSAPPPVPRWWPLRPRGPARDAQAQIFPSGASPRCFSELVVSLQCPTHPPCAGVNRGARASEPTPHHRRAMPSGACSSLLEVPGLEDRAQAADHDPVLDAPLGAGVDTFHVCLTEAFILTLSAPEAGSISKSSFIRGSSCVGAPNSQQQPQEEGAAHFIDEKNRVPVTRSRFKSLIKTKAQSRPAVSGQSQT